VALTKAERARLRRVGLTRLNKPKMTPKHRTKKAIVATRVGGKVKIIRFGAQGMGHNYSPEARRSFKARHAKNIARGKSSPAFWANKFLWAGKGGSKKMPPKSQKFTRGLKRRRG
tara:strand:- start:26 stop:370 length:345 start_codon:yes stop_codon:yes gene_type:complete